MVARTHGRTLACGAAALALTATVSACGSGSSSDARPTDAGSSRPAGATSGATTAAPGAGETSDEPTASQSTSAPAGSASSTAARQGDGHRTLRQRLLSADRMPALNDGAEWAVRRTKAREGKKPFGTCSKFAMTSIGATRVLTRTYVPADQGDATAGTSAGHLVARFPDAKTASRAYAVLQAWHDQCQDQLARYAHVDVGDARSVATGGPAVAEWYLLTYGPARQDADADYLDAQGLVRRGRTIAVLRMRAVGQDYDYPAGKSPMETAVVRAAALLG